VLPGMLTVRGVTRPVSLLIEQIAVTPESFTADGTMHIDRAEFGGDRVPRAGRPLPRPDGAGPVRTQVTAGIKGSVPHMDGPVRVRPPSRFADGPPASTTRHTEEEAQ